MISLMPFPLMSATSTDDIVVIDFPRDLLDQFEFISFFLVDEDVVRIDHDRFIQSVPVDIPNVHHL